MSDTSTIVIMTHTSVYSTLANIKGPGSKRAWAAWHTAMSKLDPEKKGTQVTRVEESLLPGAKALVDAGLFKPYGQTKDRFIISRKLAFADYEHATR